MILEITRSTSFIPKFAGNLERPMDEQIKVGHKKPTLELKKRLMKYDMKFTSDGKGDMSFESVGMPDREEVIKGLLERIENCGYAENGKERSIVNAKELLEGPVEFEDLIQEIYDHFIKIFSAKVDEKN